MSRVFSSEPDHKDKMWGENIEQPAEPGGRCELHSDDKVLHLAWRGGGGGVGYVVIADFAC